MSTWEKIRYREGGGGAALLVGRKGTPSVVWMQSVWPVFHFSSVYRSQALLFEIQNALLETITCVQFLLHLSLRQNTDWNSTRSYAVMSEGRGPIAFVWILLGRCEMVRSQMPPHGAILDAERNIIGSICNSQQMSSKCPPETRMGSWAGFPSIQRKWLKFYLQL